MAFASDLKKVTVIESADTVLIEKVRWSLRQRLRKQMHQLSADFFDEVDDFLFSGGQQGQFADQGNYLKSMRELRAKQALFEESYLDGVMQGIKASYRDYSIDPDSDEVTPRSDVVFEKVEIDLALQAMSRKADKIYAPFMKQIDSVQSKLNFTGGAEIIGAQVLAESAIDSFANAQSVFALSLDVRLVFIKLFEQHVILKMEKLFLDIISIINNVNDHNFVEKLYSSSSAFKTRITRKGHVSKEESRLDKQRNSIVNRGAQKAELVEAAVDQLVSAVCAEKKLPLFVEKMIRTKWRAVMFLIGLNRNTTGVEWNEARHTVFLLTAAVGDGIPVQGSERESIIEQLRQGFALIQMEPQEQQLFVAELENFLNSGSDEATIISTATGSPQVAADKPMEASISPAGERILDQDDLDEIAKLLGGAEEHATTSKIKRQLSEYLPEIDELGEHALVEFMINGAYEECLLKKSPASPDSYTLSQQGSNFTLNRSRLGLAIALQSGEMRIPRFNLSRNAGARTVFESSSKTRH